MSSLFTLEPVSLTVPNAQQKFLVVTFKLSAKAGKEGDRLYPATALQVSFQNGDKEAFIDRLTARDVYDVTVNDQEAGGPVSAVRLPDSAIPGFRSGGETLVKLHAWQGEKLLGSWEVGRLSVGEPEASPPHT